MARSILVGALACFALLLAAGAGAQNSPAKYSINVAKQPLTPALNALSEQTHVSWGYSPDGAAQQEPEVGPVIGEYTVEEAWTLALRGTGYKLSWIDSNNIALVKELPPPPPPKLEPPRAPGTRAGQTAGIIAEVITWGTRYLDVDVLSPPVVVIDRKTIDRFAKVYLNNNHSIKELVRAILTSDEFFSDRAFFSLIKQPVELTVGAIRMLGGTYNP